MSLSDTCLAQHAKETALTKRWLMVGLVGAAGLHAVFGLVIYLLPAESIAQLSEDRIELVVTPPVEEPEIPEPVEPPVEASPQPSTLAETVNTPAAIQAVAPPPPASIPTPTEETSEIPEPEVPEETPTEPVVEQPETDAFSELPDEDETDEDETQPTPEITAANTDAENTDEVEQTRNLLGRLFNRNQANRNQGATGPSDSTSPAASEGSSEAATRGTGNGAASEGEPVAARTGPASSGEGSGSGGSRTVSCRRCAEPDYPEEALEDGAEGNPEVRAQYDANGNVVGATLVRSSGNPALDQAALNAVRNYEFETGGQDGDISIEIDFAVEGSRRHREARRRGERRSVEVPTPAAATDSPSPAARNSPPESVSSDNETPDETPSAASGNPTPPAEASPAAADTPSEDLQAEDFFPTAAGAEESASNNNPTESSSNEPAEPVPAAETPAPEPTPQPVPQPAPQPAPEPAPQPAPEPAPEPVPQPAPQPAPVNTPDE